jgi:isopentenyl diphosphate isomerase/L-lactate dehydrogenase-like FMN-dependent dehydrogenase
MDKINKGDANKITRDYFDSLLLEMRLIGSDLPSLELSLFGETFATPIMTAALSHLQNTHPGGMAEMARGAVAANAVMWAGMGDEAELDSMIATGARTIKIIKPYKDNGVIFARLAHAEKAGAFAVGMDIDHAFGHSGGYDNIFGLEMRPKSMAELREFIAATKLPFVIKGVLSEQDAEKCLELGVSGIVVSHHHGIMDYAAPPLFMLPRIAKVVAGRIPIFVDCGVERGMDVFKALALGADAVCVGRALMGSLKEGGADAAKAAIEAMGRELSHAMAMTGSPDIRHIDPSVIVRL